MKLTPISQISSGEGGDRTNAEKRVTSASSGLLSARMRGEIDVRLQFVFEHRGLFQVLFVHALRFGVQSVVKEFVRIVKLLARGQFFPAGKQFEIDFQVS